MHAYEVVQRLAAVSAKSGKEQIVLDAYMSGCTEFFEGARLAYDPRVSFGLGASSIKGVNAEDLNPDDPGSFSWDEFKALAERLRTRSLSGNAAIAAVTDAALRCHGPTWNDFYRRVLRKDFGAGITHKTINTTLKRIKGDPVAASLMIPVFECQLAEDAAVPVHAKKVRGKKLYDIKLDGTRMFARIDQQKGEVNLLTRDGANKNDNFPDIRQSLVGLLQQLPCSTMLDGEVVAGSFQELMTMQSRKKKVDSSAAKLAMFDLIPMEDFDKGFCAIPQQDRHAALSLLETSGILPQSTGGRCYVLPKQLIDLDTKEGQEAARKFNREALDADYEGIMVKDPDAPYRCRRNAAWLKLKPVISLSMEIIAIEEGDPEGKRAGTFGAFRCRATLDDGRIVETSCGSGVSDEQIADFWARREELIGWIVEIEADKMTKNRKSAVWSLRFPRFKGFRGTEPGEKI